MSYLDKITEAVNNSICLTAHSALDHIVELAAKSKGSPKPYGNVTYADPKNGKYPIDTEEHVRAAWSYINVADNAAKYPLNGVTLDSVKSRIKSAAKKLGIDISDSDK